MFNVELDQDRHTRVRNIQFLWANQKASFNRESIHQSQPRKGAFSGISIKNGTQKMDFFLNGKKIESKG